MINALRQFLDKNNIKNKTVLTGLSGGCDSTVLVHLLDRIKNDFNIEVIAVHLNHNWRGDESLRDENFSRNFASKLGIKFYSETLPDGVKHNEVTARELRYDFFKRCAEKFKSDTVMLAHNKNDNVETLLYRIIKGTGPSGLSSIPLKRDIYYRPLLYCTREQIEHYAKENNVCSVIDSSNDDIKYKRNLIRHKIIPLMLEINTNFIESASNLITLSSERNFIIDNLLKDTCSVVKKTDDKYDRAGFLKLSYPLKAEFINNYLKGDLKNRDLKTIRKIVEFIENNDNSTLSLNAHLFLKTKNGVFYKYAKKNILRCTDEIKINDEGIYNFLNSKITVKKVESLKNFKHLYGNTCYINSTTLIDFTLRTRRQGDLIMPFGSNKVQRLKTYFINKKIPADKRDYLPVLAKGNEIYWAAPNIISDKLKVKENDEFCYKIYYEYLTDRKE